MSMQKAIDETRSNMAEAFTNGVSNVRPMASILSATDAAIAKETDAIKVKHQASVRRATAINAILTVIEQQDRARFNARDAQTSLLIENALHQLAEIAPEAPPEGTERGAADGRYSPSVDGAIDALGAGRGIGDE
jgi:hypothetical protein